MQMQDPVFAERLSNRRKRLGYTQTTLANEITKRCRARGIQKTVINRNVYTWERLGCHPRKELVPILAEVLQVDEDYLFGNTDAVPSPSDILKNPREMVHRLTDKKELILYNFQPLYFVPRNDITSGRWYIVDIENDILVSPIGNITISELDLSKDALYTKHFCTGNLTLREAEILDKVYIVPSLIKDSKLRNAIQGWYTYQRSEKAFVKADWSNYISTEHFGETYIAFNDVPSL